MRVEVLGPGGETLSAIACEPGERLLDAFDEARAPVAFGCRSATCGICLVEILEGGERLTPPDPIERLALEDLAAAIGDRLACRAAVTGVGGLVRLRPRAPR